MAANVKEQRVRKRMNRRQFSFVVAGAIAVPAIGSKPFTTSAQDATPAAGGAESLAAMEGRVFSTGPQGESPTAASEISLTEEELEEIRGMGATAAIVMHYSGDDW